MEVWCLKSSFSTTNGGSNRIYYGRYPDLISGVGEVGFKTDSVKRENEAEMNPVLSITTTKLLGYARL
jgi:hypothetical protein